MDNEEWLQYDDGGEYTVDTSFPSTFADVFSDEICKNMRTTFNEIGQIWLTIGVPTSKRDQKVNEIRNAIENQLQKILTEQKHELKKLISYHEHQLNEINKILKDLSIEPYVVDSNLTLSARNKILHSKYKQLLEIKSERLENLERITSKMKKTCHLLGITYIEPIFATNIPSEAELVSLRSSLTTDEQTLRNRQKMFDTIKGIIVQRQQELEYIPQNNTEEMFLASNQEIIYSQKNMDHLNEFHKKIINMYQKSKMEIEELQTTLGKLFDRLEVDVTTRNELRKSLADAITIPRQKRFLEVQIEKYEILKKSCMEKIIISTRKDIMELYRQCMVDPSYNEPLLESTEFTEELLIEHEKEFTRLSRFHELYKEVFGKLLEWENSLEKLLDLEKKALDPNRFNNRGGALLQAERDRKMLSKKLPRLQAQVQSLVTVIESKENFPFNHYGLNLDEYFDSNLRHFQQSKDDMKCNKINGAAQKQLSGGYSSKKNLLSGQKTRYPLSPRVPNITKSNSDDIGARRQLFGQTAGSSTKKYNDLVNEVEFQKNLILKQDMCSTFVDDGNQAAGNMGSSKSKLLNRSPTVVALRKKVINRRISRSCDDLAKLIKSNRQIGQPNKPVRKPPFL